MNLTGTPARAQWPRSVPPPGRLLSARGDRFDGGAGGTSYESGVSGLRLEISDLWWRTPAEAPPEISAAGVAPNKRVPSPLPAPTVEGGRRLRQPSRQRRRPRWRGPSRRLPPDSCARRRPPPAAPAAACHCAAAQRQQRRPARLGGPAGGAPPTSHAATEVRRRGHQARRVHILTTQRPR